MNTKPRLTSLDWEAVRRRLSDLSAEASAEIGPQRARAMMDVRAAELARVGRQFARSEELLDLVVFSLNDERFAIEARFVHFMLDRVEITRVPGVPELLVGVVIFRGSVLGVFDLARLLGLPAADERPYVLVLGNERAEFGLAAAVVGEMLVLPADAIFPPESSGLSDACVRGVTKDAMVVLDGAALLADSRLFIDESG